jgi:hypothetical protein
MNFTSLCGLIPQRIKCSIVLFVQFSLVKICQYLYKIGCPKRSSPKNWKGRDEGEDPGKDGKRK